MKLATRSAMLQMRVTPGVKRASEEVLQRIGITMTDAMELFLRRMIVDQRIPFEVVALDEIALGRINDARIISANRKAIGSRIRLIRPRPIMRTRSRSASKLRTVRYLRMLQCRHGKRGKWCIWRYKSCPRSFGRQ